MDMQPIQTALKWMTWAPIIGLLIGLTVMATMIFLVVWLRHKFPAAPTRIEIVHVNRDGKEVNAPTNETASSKPKTSDDSRYLPKTGL
jgi:hypothetical protein